MGRKVKALAMELGIECYYPAIVELPLRTDHAATVLGVRSCAQKDTLL